MRRNCPFFRHYLNYLHLGCILSLWSISSMSQVLRAPANYVPDDDMIVVPMVIERNTMEEFHERHKDKFVSAKRQLRKWMSAQEYIEAYGLEGTGAATIPTPEQKQKFFERNYLRFLTSDVQTSTNTTLKESIEEITADDELASIETFEAREEYIVEARKETGTNSSKNIIKEEIKVGKEKFKFDIQPRVEMGMIKVNFKSRFVSMRAWVGVNGNQEVKFYRRFANTKTNAQLNYFIEQRRILASIDQPLAQNWSLRLTHDKQEADLKSNGLLEDREKSIIQIRFGKRF